MVKLTYHSMTPEQGVYYVYFMFFRGRTDRFVKIGRTGNLLKRIHDLDKANPLELTNIFVIPCPNPILVDAMEYLFQYQLGDLRVKGEWFFLCYEFFESLGNVMNLLNEPQYWEIDNILPFGNNPDQDLKEFLNQGGFPHDFNWADIFSRPNDFQIFPVSLEGDVSTDECDLCEMTVLAFPEALDRFRECREG